MQDLTREYMLGLARSVTNNQAFADRLGRSATALAAGGHDEEAAAFFAATRNHRIQALKDEAELGALAWRHGPLHRE